MGRRPIGKRAMTAAERKRKERAKNIVTEPVTKPDVTKPVTESEPTPSAELIEARKEIEWLKEILKIKDGNISGLKSQRLNLREVWWTAKEFRLILSCLHPDARISISEEKLSEAFRMFDSLIKPLVMTKDEEAEHRRRVEMDLQSVERMRQAFAQRARKAAEDRVRDAERREARSVAAKARAAAKKQEQAAKRDTTPPSRNENDADELT